MDREEILVNILQCLVCDNFYNCHSKDKEKEVDKSKQMICKEVADRLENEGYH